MPLHPLLGLPACLKEPVDAEKAMATHLQPHPGVCFAGDRVADRFRHLCAAQEMLYIDTREKVEPALKGFLAAAQRENTGIHPDSIVQADETFLLNALADMETLAKGFNLVPILGVTDRNLADADATLEVEFSALEAPEEDSLLFGVEYTDLRKEYAGALPGSLRKTPRGSYTASFELRPMLAVLPAPGKYPFWLGGRTANGHPFAGRIVKEVVSPK